jgi:hypothetical protein
LCRSGSLPITSRGLVIGMYTHLLVGLSPQVSIPHLTVGLGDRAATETRPWRRDLARLLMSLRRPRKCGAGGPGKASPPRSRNSWHFRNFAISSGFGRPRPAIGFDAGLRRIGAAPINWLQVIADIPIKIYESAAFLIT